MKLSLSTLRQNLGKTPLSMVKTENYACVGKCFCNSDVNLLDRKLMLLNAALKWRRRICNVIVQCRTSVTAA